MSLGRLTSPQSQWEGLQVTNIDQCLHIVMIIGKYAGVFRRIFWLGGAIEKRGIGLGNFQSRNFSWWKKISMKGVQDLLAL